MERQQVKDFVEFLERIGFQGERFEKELQKLLPERPDSFQLTEKKNFGEEQMRYNIHFVRDFQFESYRMDKYDAIYRRPVEITHKGLINGIDTQRLDEEMQAVDWENYFAEDKKPLVASKEDNIKSILESWAEVGERNKDIQMKLGYKYFPEHAWHEDIAEFRHEYETKRSFETRPNGICHPNLAYHIMSGRLDDLNEKFRYMELDRFTSFDLRSRLESILTENPDRFEIKGSISQRDGLVDFSVPVSKLDNWYELDVYHVSLTPYEPIQHGIYNTINTGELENAMQKIDWHNDRTLFVFHRDAEPEMLPPIIDIQNQLNQLRQDVIGKHIADQLQLKYMATATYFEDALPQAVWDYLETLPERKDSFPAGIEMGTAYNLLSGRAVLENHVFKFEPSKDVGWQRLDFSNKDTSGYGMIYIDGFPKEELDRLVDLLPISDRVYIPVADALAKGYLVSVKLKNDKDVLLEANPEGKTVNIFTPDMQPISANLRLDPGWQPTLPIQAQNAGSAQKIEESKKRTIPKDNKRRNHRKGKGL